MSVLFDLEHDMQERHPLVFAESSFELNGGSDNEARAITFLGGAVQSESNKALVRTLLRELEEHLVSRNVTRVFQRATTQASARKQGAQQTHHQI
jgi:hypothetical protein